MQGEREITLYGRGPSRKKKQGSSIYRKKGQVRIHIVGRTKNPRK